MKWIGGCVRGCSTASVVYFCVDTLGCACTSFNCCRRCFFYFLKMYIVLHLNILQQQRSTLRRHGRRYRATLVLNQLYCLLLFCFAF